MLILIDKNSPFFDKKTAMDGYNRFEKELDYKGDFEHLYKNSMFWNVYNHGYVGTVFVYQGSKDNNWYLGGWSERKRHKDCVCALKKISDLFEEIYAETHHVNAVICLKAAGFDWKCRNKGLLIRRKK